MGHTTICYLDTKPHANPDTKPHSDPFTYRPRFSSDFPFREHFECQQHDL